MSKYYNKKMKSIEEFKRKDLVMLNGKNIRSKGRCKKLEDKMYGPFEILSVGHNGRYYKLKLPVSCKIHPTFNIGLLEKYQGKNPEKEVVEIEADDAGWKMELIITSGPLNDDVIKHVYLVKWEGYSHEENTWESYENVNENSRELLEDYYEKHDNMERDERFVRRKSLEKDVSAQPEKTRIMRKSKKKKLVFTLLCYICFDFIYFAI